MPQIPKTFCPAKWDEIMLNYTYNYVFACCKATPVKFYQGDYKSVVNKQKENLLNDVQDPSCDYCWKVENKNLTSKRHEYLKLFDVTKFNLYKTNSIEPTVIELYIGNECNFQCTYCNSKYSSQWESDVRKKSYKIFTDRHFYGIDKKNQQVVNQTLDITANLNTTACLNIIGGEPLLNKLFWKILDTTTVENFLFATNLSCKTYKELDRLIQKSNKFKNFYISVSLDSTNENAEFTRYGLNFKLFEKNLDYLVENSTENMHININAVISSITVHDMQNFVDFIKGKKLKHQKLTCSISPCIHPRIQSFDTLPDEYKPNALNILKELKTYNYFKGVDMVESSLISSKFNNTLYQEMKQFLFEFSSRKKIKIPICLN